MSIRHIFFDLHDTLINKSLLTPCWAKHIAYYLAQDYGGTPALWHSAYLQVVADWHSYFADLNLSGDEGLQDLWEGMYRVNRALFRLTNTPEPLPDDLWRITRDIPARIPAYCNAVYVDVPDVLNALCAMNLSLNIASHLLVTQARAILKGGKIDSLISGLIIGADSANCGEKDASFYRYCLQAVSAHAEDCLVVAGDRRALLAVQSIGMKTAWIQREGDVSRLRETFDFTLVGTLANLPEQIAQHKKKGDISAT